MDIKGDVNKDDGRVREEGLMALAKLILSSN